MGDKIIFSHKCITKEELGNNPKLKNSKKLITLKIKNLGDGSVLITKIPYKEYKEIED